MKVRTIMTTDIGFCNLTDTLTKAAVIMRHKDCGVVPLVNEEKRIVGMITDRDICIAAGERNQKLSTMKSEEMIKGEIVSCKVTDKIETALKKMRKNQLKRLPITGKNSELVGILSITDILLSRRINKKLKKQIFRTLQAIATSRPIVLKEISQSVDNAKP